MCKKVISLVTAGILLTTLATSSASALNSNLTNASLVQSIDSLTKKFNQQGIGGRHKFTPKGAAMGYLKSANTQKKLNMWIQDVKARKILARRAGEEALANWEVARNQAKITTESFIKYLELLKRTLQSGIDVKKTITEINSTSFLDNEIAAQGAYLAAYNTITQEWIAQMETSAGQEIDDEEFAMNVLAAIGTVQTLHVAYISSFGVVGANGLIMAKANTAVLEKQYAFASDTLPAQIETYATNLLKLEGTDFESFVAYYNGRITSDIVPNLDTVATKTDEAIAIFVNDIHIHEELYGKAQEIIQQLTAFVTNPAELTEIALLELLDNLSDIANSIKELVEAGEVNGTSAFRATEQIKAITETYSATATLTAAIYKDLAFEWTIRNDATHCKKWQEASTTNCEY